MHVVDGAHRRDAIGPLSEQRICARGIVAHRLGEGRPQRRLRFSDTELRLQRPNPLVNRGLCGGGRCGRCRLCGRRRGRRRGNCRGCGELGRRRRLGEHDGGKKQDCQSDTAYKSRDEHDLPSCNQSSQCPWPCPPPKPPPPRASCQPPPPPCQPQPPRGPPLCQPWKLPPCPPPKPPP